MVSVLADPWAPVIPAKLICPTWDYTLGAEVADLCALLGYNPMPEQELFLDAVFGFNNSDGLPAVSDAVDLAGRQNLKTGEFVMTAFGWLFITKEKRTLWSAHEFSTTRDAFLLMRGLLEKHSWANALVRQYYASSNYTAIALTDDRVLEFTARTTSLGRGKAAPKAIWDEGLELRAEHLGAQDAVKSTYPWAQTLIGSSGLKSYSEVLHPIVDKAWAGELGPRDFFREFRDDLPGACELGDECTHVYGTPGCRLDEVERYRRNNPALGRIHIDGRGLTLAAIQRERAKQPDPLIFARERLGWHDKLVSLTAAVFTEEVWDDLKDPHSKITGQRIFALQVSPLRDWSAIMVGGYNSAGRVHLETTSSKPDPDKPRVYNRRASTDWVVPWFKARAGKGRNQSMTLLVLADTQAMSLVPALKKIRGLRVVVLPGSAMPAACGHLLDLVSAGDVAHVGDPELSASMKAVGKQMVGGKTFVWSPRSSKGDITAAWAATLIAWRLELGVDYDPEESVG